VALTGTASDLVSVTTTPMNATNTIWVVATAKVSRVNGTPAADFVIRRGSGCAGGTQVGSTITVILPNAANAGDNVTLSFVDVPATTTAVGYHFCATETATNMQTMAASITVQTAAQGADLAEVYYSYDATLTPGEVVALDPEEGGLVKRAEANDQNAIGIVSTYPGSVMSYQPKAGTLPVLVGLSGRVPVKASTENGPIKAGDALAPAATPGYVAKAIKPGLMLGRALTALTSLTQAGTGETVTTTGNVLMFVQNGYYIPQDKATTGSNTSTADLVQDAQDGSDIQLPADAETVNGLRVGTIVVQNAKFTGRVVVEGTLVMSATSNAGRFVVPPETERVHINFPKAYSFTPRVFVTPTLHPVKGSQGVDPTAWDGNFYIGSVSSTGFNVYIPNGGYCRGYGRCPVELILNWFVIRIDGAEDDPDYTGSAPDPVQESAPGSIPAPTPAPAPEPTPAPAETTSTEPTVSQEPAPAPEESVAEPTPAPTETTTTTSPSVPAPEPEPEPTVPTSTPSEQAPDAGSTTSTT
jgi:hypothetical protein